MAKNQMQSFMSLFFDLQNKIAMCMYVCVGWPISSIVIQPVNKQFRAKSPWVKRSLPTQTSALWSRLNYTQHDCERAFHTVNHPTS